MVGPYHKNVFICFQDAPVQREKSKPVKRKTKPESDENLEKRSKKKKGPDVQMSTVKFSDVGGNEATLVVSTCTVLGNLALLGEKQMLNIIVEFKREIYFHEAHRIHYNWIDKNW